MSDLHHLIAPAHWQQIDFISDIHLSPTMPLTAALWRQYLCNTQADAVFILGDLFEAWIGDDLLDAKTASMMTPSSHNDLADNASTSVALQNLAQFAQKCVQTLAQASLQRRIFVMHGNRDFLLGDHFAQSAHVHMLPETTTLEAFGHRYALCHGDAQCWDDHPYMAARAQVRNPTWQEAILKRSLTERLVLAQTLRENKNPQSIDQDVSSPAWIDLNPQAVDELMEATQCHALIHGHTHHPDVHVLGAHKARWVLSDWCVEPDAPKARAIILELNASGLSRRSLVD